MWIFQTSSGQCRFQLALFNGCFTMVIGDVGKMVTVLTFFHHIWKICCELPKHKFSFLPLLIDRRLMAEFLYFPLYTKKKKKIKIFLKIRKWQHFYKVALFHTSLINLQKGIRNLKSLPKKHCFSFCLTYLISVKLESLYI